jgi:hypothetical protein
MLKYYFKFFSVFIFSVHLFALDELSDIYLCDDTEQQELIENFDGHFNPWNLDSAYPAEKGDNTSFTDTHVAEASFTPEAPIYGNPVPQSFAYMSAYPPAQYLINSSVFANIVYLGPTIINYYHSPGLQGLPPELPNLPAEKIEQAPKVIQKSPKPLKSLNDLKKKKRKNQKQLVDASPKKKRKVDSPPIEREVLTGGKSPVMQGFLYSVQLKKGGEFSDRKNGVIAVTNYRKLLKNTDAVSNKKNPTSNEDHRTKALDRWFDGIPQKIDRGGYFTLTIKNNFKKKYKKLLETLPPFDDEKYSSGNSSEDISSDDISSYDGN